MNDEKLQELYDQYLNFTDQMVEEHGAMEVAAIMMAQSMSIYKTAMSDDDFNRMVDTISASRNKVQTFSKPVFQ